MTTNTGSFTKALWPGVNAWYGEAYNEHKVEYTDLFETHTSRRGWEEDVATSGLGLAKLKGEGAPIEYDDMHQGFIDRYTHATYALGFVVTKEAFSDDQYDVVGKKRARGLAFSLRQTKEILGANIYNRAFNSSYTYGDGVELCSTAHPKVAGGTWANELATAADISEASLEQACIDLMKFTDDRGKKIAVMPRKLIIPVDLVFEAERILKSPARYGTSDNDLNALKTMGKFQDGVVVNHYLTDTDAWFIRTNVTDGMKYFNRWEDSFDMDDDWDTDNAKFKGSFRCSFGATDKRAIFGSPGA